MAGRVEEERATGGTEAEGTAAAVTVMAAVAWGRAAAVGKAKAAVARAVAAVARARGGAAWVAQAAAVGAAWRQTRW